MFGDLDVGVGSRIAIDFSKTAKRVKRPPGETRFGKEIRQVICNRLPSEARLAYTDRYTGWLPPQGLTDLAIPGSPIIRAMASHASQRRCLDVT